MSRSPVSGPETGSSGVPVGTQIETPVMIATGCPFENTRVAPTTHWPVTHGPLPAAARTAHPATAYGAAIVAIGMPETNTDVLGTVGIA